MHFEIDYKSKESTDKEKDEVNEGDVEADKGHKSDIKSNRKAAIEWQYKRRLRDKYGWQVNVGGGKMLKLKNDMISSRLFSLCSIYKLETLFSQ